MKKALLAVTLLLFWASSAWCQRDGAASFGATDSFQYDTINLTTLVPSINLPVVGKSVGALPGSIILESPQTCRVVSTLWTCGSSTTQVLAPFYFIPQTMMGMLPVYSTSRANGCTTYTITGLTGTDNVSFYPTPTALLSYPSTCGSTSVTKITNDNTGITVTYDSSTGQGVTANTISNKAGWTNALSSNVYTLTDPFSNTTKYDTSGATFTDSLGAITTLGTGTPSPNSYKYKDTSGTTQTVTLNYGTSTTFKPFIPSCGNATDNSQSATPLSSISYPDGTSFSLGWQTGNGTGTISGLINSLTLRTGGAITYTYSAPVQNCNVYEFSSLSRATPDGTTSYTLSTTSGVTTTTVLDPGKNKTVYLFGTLGGGVIPNYLQSVARYQNTGTVASPSYTEISSTSYCYNTHISDCATYNPTPPITQVDTYQYAYTNATPQVQVQMTHDVKTYDSYGNMLTDAATDSITSQTITTTIVYGTDSSGTCVAITNTEVLDHPCTVTTKNGSTWISGSTYTYNANGALTSSAACLSSTCTGTSALTTTYTPTTQGTYSAIQDPNGQTVNYTYGSCNSLMLTDVTTTVNSVAIDRKATWNCDAGVTTDTTDANSNEDDTTYDSMNRISTYHDRMGDTNTTSYAYGTPTLDHVKVTDNIGVVSYQYNDGLGRPTVHQICETTGCTTLDTVSVAYGWKDSGNNALTNFQTTTSGGSSSAACTTTTPGSTCSSVTLTALTNPIAGPYKTTDANSGTGTYAVNSKDFSFTAGPAPSGEHTKVVQTEVDGFGRVTSTCALENSGGTSCGQTMGNSGILTSNVYSFATAAPKVVTTRGSQSHTIVADALGRTTSITLPETGSTAETMVYDSAVADNCGGARNSYGDLVRDNLPDGSNYICYLYDGLHRVTDVANSSSSHTVNPCKRFKYDSTANKNYTGPTDYPSSGNNIIGRLFEASTDNCGTTALTDTWLAYDKEGRITDRWEWTSNSGGYYHVTVAYDADGQVTALSGIPSYSTVTYGVDGEERWNSLTYGSTTIVSATAGSGFKYDAAGAPTNIPIGSGTNQDAYTYDQLENMLTYTFPVSTHSDAGTLTWNSIGSLGKRVTNDTIPSSTDSETCAYAYDDVGRLTSAATITGSTCNGPMTYGYDQYDNMWQSGSFSYGCSTCYSSTTNQQTGTPTLTYDSNGNVTGDQTNTFTWNLYGQIASEIPSTTAAVCGTSGTCDVYDALGNLVEQQFNGSNAQYLYSPIGLVAKMSGQTTTWEFVPAPGGGHFWQVGSTGYFVHTDWLGTERMVDTISGTNYNIQAYAPYGQQYDTLGSSFQFFTGLLQDDASVGVYRTPNRALPQVSARWLSPDKCKGCGWNAYAYVTDPNTQTDPSGLCGSDGTGPCLGLPGNDCSVSASDDCEFTSTEAQTYNLEFSGDSSGSQGQEAELTGTVSGSFLSGFLPPPIATDAAAGMINSHILSDVFNAGSWGELGQRMWRNFKAGGCPDPGQLCQGIVTPPEAEWARPTFEIVAPVTSNATGPSYDLVHASLAFAKKNRFLEMAQCGDCYPASTGFQGYAATKGVTVNIMKVNAYDFMNSNEVMSESHAAFLGQRGNPQLNYTGVTTHWIAVSEDGWAVDMSARQFDRGISFPYIFRLIKK